MAKIYTRNLIVLLLTLNLILVSCSSASKDNTSTTKISKTRYTGHPTVLQQQINTLTLAETRQAVITDSATTHIITTPVPPSTKTPVISELTPTPGLANTQKITATAIPYLTSTQVMTWSEMHINISDSLPEDVVLDGYLVIRDEKSPLIMNIWNLETGDSKQLNKETEHFYFCSISLNGLWLVCDNYSPSDGNRLFIYDSNGESKLIIPWNEKWFTPIWKSNDRIVFRGYPNEDELAIEKYVLEPFSDRQYELTSLQERLKDMSVMFSGLAETETQLISFDPTLTYVVYPTADGYVNVENVNTKEIVARTGTIWEAVPRWAPDGKSFLLRTYLEENGKQIGTLYRIYLDGKLEMLIKLPENQDIERTSYYWSPDGRYVAFWWIPDIDEFPVVMAVLDMETHEFVDYGIQNLYSYKYAPEIFWSPDSQYVLFQVWEEIDSEFSKLVIVDIHEGRAAQIEENVVPYGWMTDSEP